VHKYVQRLLTVGNRLMFDAQNQPFWLINSLGEVAEQVVLRAIFLEEMLPQSEFEGLLHLMQAGQLQALSQNWVAHSPAETFLTNYLRLTEFFVRELKKQGLEKELTETVRFQAKIAAPLKARELNLEGTWLLSGRDKQKWVLTIAFARGTDVFLCLADSGGFVNKSFFSLAYSPDDVSFVASERERTDDPSRNRALKFKLLADGSLELRDLASDALLKGQKTQSYPNYFEDSNPSAPTSPSGKYVGTVYMGDGFVKKMTLTVSAFKGYTVASMVGDSTQISFDFNIGTAGTDGVLYLSTGSQERANYSQLRGLLKNGEFRGRAIVGGKGISDKEFLLKKVNE
jgi:hypothetical protein